MATDDNGEWFMGIRDIAKAFNIDDHEIENRAIWRKELDNFIIHEEGRGKNAMLRINDVHILLIDFGVMMTKKKLLALMAKSKEASSQKLVIDLEKGDNATFKFV
jgi:hypothetical protein